MDIEMPLMDGYQCTKYIRDIYKDSCEINETLIIACTGYVGQED